MAASCAVPALPFRSKWVALFSLPAVLSRLLATNGFTGCVPAFRQVLIFCFLTISLSTAAGPRDGGQFEKGRAIMNIPRRALHDRVNAGARRTGENGGSKRPNPSTAWDGRRRGALVRVTERTGRCVSACPVVNTVAACPAEANAFLCDAAVWSDKDYGDRHAQSAAVHTRKTPSKSGQFSMEIPGPISAENRQCPEPKLPTVSATA